MTKWILDAPGVQFVQMPHQPQSEVALTGADLVLYGPDGSPRTTRSPDC